MPDSDNINQIFSKFKRIVAFPTTSNPSATSTIAKANATANSEDQTNPAVSNYPSSNLSRTHFNFEIANNAGSENNSGGNSSGSSSHFAKPPENRMLEKLLHSTLSFLDGVYEISLTDIFNQAADRNEITKTQADYLLGMPTLELNRILSIKYLDLIKKCVISFNYTFSKSYSGNIVINGLCQNGSENSQFLMEFKNGSAITKISFDMPFEKDESIKKIILKKLIEAENVPEALRYVINNRSKAELLKTLG